jgi:hypothetical protein
MNVDQRVVLDTWTSFPEQNKQGRGGSLKASRGGEYLFEYRIDVMSDQGTSRPVTGRDVVAMKQRLCAGRDIVFGIVGGQDSGACKEPAGKRK